MGMDTVMTANRVELLSDEECQAKTATGSGRAGDRGIATPLPNHH